ncbi:hypothetical protein [Streptomyces orinoci]|uniref:Secreted protein n=1 Tax=Streptomyces orinoci TaxID=67339 RepID=A0ABV3JVC0_STRON|nr:hypothetical protein [Streptomyces orinoci]
MRLRARRALFASVVVTGCAVFGITTHGTAAAIGGAAESASPPFAVETFEYPNAAKILQEQGIALRSGDGHILLADCKVSADIQVFTSQDHPGQTDRGKYCFKVTGSGKSGYLKLEIPKVFNVATGDYAVRASVTAEGKTQTVNVAKNDFEAVGQGVDPKAQPTVLVELRVTG